MIAGASRLAALGLLLGTAVADAADVPAACSGRPVVRDDVTPVPELRRHVETLGETDPLAALDLLCGTLPRVAREKGEDSLELARWRQALATPLIAYLNRFAEAEALLAQARPVLERKLGPSSPEVAELYVASAWMAFRRGQMEEAGAAWSKALRIREQHPGRKQVELQKVLVGLAQVRLSQRRFAESRQLAARSLSILQANGETVSEAAAATRNLQANIALREENFTEARRYAEHQIAIELTLHEQGGPDQPVTAYAMLGQILQRLDEYEEAERALREAVRLAESREGPLQRNALVALLQLAALLNERGNPRDAATFARKALDLGERELGAEAPTLIPVLSNLAEAERGLGNLSPALRYSERAAGIVAAHATDAPREAVLRFHRRYGALLLEVGDAAAAEGELRAAAEIGGADATLSTDRAAALVVLARLLRPTDAGEARRQLQAALALYQARLPDGHPLIARVVNEICGIEIDLPTGDLRACDEAIGRLRRARSADPALRQEVLLNQSELASRRADPGQMQSYAVESLAAALTLGTPDPLWKANLQLARALHRRQLADLAVFFGKEAVDQLQRLRRSLVGADLRLDPLFVRDKVAVYRDLADWLMEAGRLEEALEVLGLLKSEELSGFLLRSAADDSGARVSRNPAEAALQSRYRSLAGADAAAGADIDELSRLQEAGRISPAERARLEALLAASQADESLRAARLVDFLAAGSGSTGATAVPEGNVRVPRLDREVRRLGPDAVVAFYLLTEDSLRIVIASRQRQFEYRAPIDAGQLRRDIGTLLDDIAGRREVRGGAQRLFDVLLRPVAEEARAAGATRLVLWPDGPLRYVPFAALNDGERDVVERYAVQLYGPAAAGASGASRRAPALTVRGLGVTRAVSGYTALPSMADELCSIVRGPIVGLEAPGAQCRRAAGAVTGGGALRGEGYADAAFTSDRLEAPPDRPRDFSVLHVGTHFALRPGNAVRSFLVLGDGTRLMLDRLASIDFSGIDLMTLSGCQTALGGAVMDDGREVEGLAALAQRAGVQTVLASLWRVEDRSTALLMGEFYRRLAGGRASGASALRDAQLDIRNSVVDGRQPFRHPYYWAAFTLAAGGGR